MGLLNPSLAQEEGSGDNATVSVVFSEVSETRIVGQSPELGIELSAVRENDNDVVSIQLGDSKTLTLSRNLGNLNFYVMSNQLETTTSVVIQNEDSLAIDSLAQYLWQYRGYSVLGDTLLDALLVLSNWPQGQAFEEEEVEGPTEDPDRGSTPTYPLTVTISPNTTAGKVTSGTSLGSINCGNGGYICKVIYGGTVTLTATPAVGYIFKGWSGACTGTTTSCTVNMTVAKSVTATFTLKSYSLTVTTSPANSGSVSSSPSGINCGSVCSYSFPQNNNVTLTATPSSGYSFKNWSGACIGTTTSCTVSMTEAKSVTANFLLRSALLSVILNPSNGGEVKSVNEVGINCGNGKTACSMYPTLRQVGLNVTSAPSYFFTGWSQGCGQNPNCLVSINGDTSVTANFVQNPISIEIKPSKTSGNVTSSPSGLNCGNLGNVCSYIFDTQVTYGQNAGNLYDPNATVFYMFTNDGIITLTANPIKGYVFSEWGGACDGRESTCNIVPTEPKTAIANFAKENLLSVIVPTGSAAGNVTSYPSGINCGISGSVCTFGFVGDVILLAPEPAYGYVFDGWEGSCKEVDEVRRTCKVSMTAANTVKVKFIRGYYLIVDVYLDKDGASVLREMIQTVTVTNTSSGQQFKCTSNGISSRSCRYPFPPDTFLEVTATPSGVFKFSGWEDACRGSGSCQIIMNRTRTIKAVFSLRGL